MYIILMAVLGGFFVGKIFAFPVLLLITASLVLASFFSLKEKDKDYGEVKKWSYITYAAIVTLVMWSTFYHTSGWLWVGNFLTTYVFR